MKKAVSIMLFFALFLLLAGCKEVPVSESSEPLNSNNVIKWFDCLNGDEMAWDGVKEYDLDEFSGVTFRWHPERLEAVADGTTIPLYDGMPIWSVYFYDLTGDGNPELCSTISFGSGIIDDRIIIYDYAGGASYELSDRGNFDYVLNMQEDSLIVEKRAYMQDELIESGEYNSDKNRMITASLTVSCPPGHFAVVFSNQLLAVQQKKGPSPFERSAYDTGTSLRTQRI